MNSGLLPPTLQLSRYTAQLDVLLAEVRQITTRVHPCLGQHSWPRRDLGSSMNDSHSDSKVEDQKIQNIDGRPADEDCPIAKNAGLLRELDVAEGQVAELLEVAAVALDELAGVESLDNAKVEASTQRFLALISSVHGCLSSKARLIRDYTPYPRSTYGPRQELELLHEKARFLRSELASMSRKSSVDGTGDTAPLVGETLMPGDGLASDFGVGDQHATAGRITAGGTTTIGVPESSA